MQPGFDGAHRNTDKLLNFSEFIALGVVQEHDQPMFVAELLQRPVQLLQFFETLVVECRVFGAGKAFKAVTAEHAFLDGMQPLACEAALFVNKQIVHNAAQPGAGLVDFHEVVDFAVGLDEEFLEQVLGFGFAACQSPGKTIQAVEMRPDDAFESVAVFGDDGLLQAFKVPPATRLGALPGRRRTGCNGRA